MWNTDDSVETYFWSWTRCCNRDDRCREWYTKDTTQFSEKRNRDFSLISCSVKYYSATTPNIAYRTGRQFPPGRGVRIGDYKNAAFYMSVEPHKRSELKTSYFEAGFHYRQSRCRSRNQKRRTLRSTENSVLIPLTIKWKLVGRSRMQKRKN